MKALATAACASAALGVCLHCGEAIASPAELDRHLTGECQTASCVERVAGKRCSQSRVLSCIHRAALRWRVSFAMLKRKARCESRFDPYAVNGPHAGLFQFRVNKPSTWATTPYASRSPWWAKWNALAAAWMHHVGRGGEWACQ
jgi:hypothetical protein